MTQLKGDTAPQLELFHWKGNHFYVRSDSDRFVIREQLLYTKRLDLRADDVLLDLGGYIGDTAVVMAPFVQHVVSVEPDPAQVELYRKNTQLNNVASTLYPVAAVGNEDTSRTLYLADVNHGANSFLIKRNRQAVTVPAVNINTILAQHWPTVWKIDVEGAEYELLPAISPTYWAGCRELIVEFHHAVLKDVNHAKHAEIVALLSQHFPAVHAPEPKKNWHTLISASKCRVL